MERRLLAALHNIILIASPTSARKDFDPMPKLVLIYRPRKTLVIARQTRSLMKWCRWVLLGCACTRRRVSPWCRLSLGRCIDVPGPVPCRRPTALRARPHHSGGVRMRWLAQLRARLHCELWLLPTILLGDIVRCSHPVVTEKFALCPRSLADTLGMDQSLGSG